LINLLEFLNIFLYLDEKRRQKAIEILLESTIAHPASTLLDTKQTESAALIQEDLSLVEIKDEEAVKVKPSALPLMNQVKFAQQSNKEWSCPQSFRHDMFI
jgi:hypothetical protein